MTLLDKLHAEHPNAPTLSDGQPVYCPCHYKLEEYWDCGTENKISCKSCWNREVPEVSET